MATVQLASGVVGTPEIPAIRVVHIETPPRYAEFEQSSLGEGGAPAATTPSAMHARASVRRLWYRSATPDRIVAAIRSE
jgi:hypothetical protein